MRIVHVIDYFQPALGYQETFLAREQLRLGHTVTVVTSNRYAPFPDYARTTQPLLGGRIRPAGRGTEEGIPVWRLPVRLEYGYRCWLKGLEQTLTTLRPEVMHAHGVVKLSSLQVVLLKPRLGYHLLVDDHMHRVNVNHGWSGALFYRTFQLVVAPLFRRRVDALAAITDETAAIVREVYGLTTPPVRVIELGVDTQLFCPNQAARQALRHTLGLAPTDFLVLYTGKIIQSKAPHWLLEALPHCPSQVKVLLLGNAAAAYRQQIDRIIAAHSLEGRVLLHAAVKQVELPRYYAAADMGCWPREASMAMFEAAACSLPIVIARGESAQRVRYGNGLEYRQGDVGDLARCVTQLAQDPAQARQMGAQGRQLVEDHHSWQAINRQFLAAYQHR
jgi:glycosyltransferase involved in cell wall biosynthesis